MEYSYGHVEMEYSYGRDGQRYTLPFEVSEWLGIEFSDVLLRDLDACYVRKATAVILNDRGTSFDQIADLIEEEFDLTND